MVFFNKRMTRTVVVPPDHLGAGLKDYVRALLIANVEGMPLDDFGYIISVLEVNEAGMTHGLIDHFTGSVKYNVDFRALVFRPFRNEVLDGVVISVTQMGMWADVGPINVFISSVHIPADMEFNAADDSFTSPETSVKIRGGSSIRLKVLGATILATTQTAIGTINEPFLGFHT